jgi:hypothetical protein
MIVTLFITLADIEDLETTRILDRDHHPIQTSKTQVHRCGLGFNLVILC